MGLLRDLATLNRQGNELSRNVDVSASMARGLTTMQAANEMLRRQTANVHLITAGVDATATITAVRPTGAYLNFAPVVQIDLLVMRGAPIPVTHQEAVQQAYLGRLHVGATLRLKVDPHDASRLWIDWNQLF